MKCVLFPEDVTETFCKRRTPETQKATKSSWEKCGDSFLDTPGMERAFTCIVWKCCTARGIKHLPFIHSSGGEDPVHIAWTSSEDEQSDSEHQLPLPHAVTKSTLRSRSTPRTSSRYSRFLSTGADTDELPTIDSESEHEDISTQQISLVSAEISDCSSDSDHNTSRLDSSAQEQSQQNRSISEWVRSAQALLQTPQKQTDKNPSKTPEDSGKKKRKFESQGLAERLNRLQCRQRSAISFWRHQPVSGFATGTEERPGVLVLHVHKVQEVCGMRAALCHRHPDRGMSVALFSKETANQLAPSTGDTIHVHPPWQSLTVDGENYPIILNTHFSQKVVGDEKQDNSVKLLCLKEKAKPYPLTRCLWKSEENSTQASASNKQYTQTHGDAGNAFKSLLEALEACGTSATVSGPVEVVVQRIYFYSVTQMLHTSLPRHPTLSKCRSGRAQQQHVGRCCLLVQDVYGMFSEVEMQCASSEEEQNDYTKQMLGKTCLLQGLKVIRRLTRERFLEKVHAVRLWVSYQYLTLYKCLEQLYLRLLNSDWSESMVVCMLHLLNCYGKEEKDLLLFVTDASLQDEQRSEGVRRTLPVYVNSTSLLQPSVLQAIAAPSPQFRPRFIFTDAVIEQGESVVQLDLEPLQHQDIPSPQSVVLDQLSAESPSCSLCTVTGVVMDIDENSAYSWPTCSQCGGDCLEASEDKPCYFESVIIALFCRDVFSCVACGLVDKPCRKMQLEVFLNCPPSSHWTVKIKGYEAEAVLGKSVGPLNAFIHVVARSSALWMALEEIIL
ncbi:DNA repair-scaffolding protein [Silurus asotus]|uniref:DNA repair-scaffolding protein n=1 Tax=Silurus asotus TaxID=30991 RepID=A0AAD5FLZ0_SILAS|nr:DNA repair-scaffolding protein [Silurus asotus]